MFAKREHLVDYQTTSIGLVERVFLKLRLTRPAASEARQLPSSLVLRVDSGKVVLAAVRDRGDTGLLSICLLTDLGRPVPVSRSRCTNTLCTMKRSCTHWRPCLGPASVPLHSSALLTWGGQHGHHHYGSQQAERGHCVRTRRGRVGRD